MNSMQLNRDMGDNINIEVRVLDSWSIGNVVRNTLRDIFDRTRVVGPIYIVHKGQRLLGMLVREFLIFMHHWITNKQTIRHLSLRWTITFVIKLF